MTIGSIGRRLGQWFLQDRRSHPSVAAAACEVLEQRRLLVSVTGVTLEVDAPRQEFTIAYDGPVPGVSQGEIEGRNLTQLGLFYPEAIRWDATTKTYVSKFHDPYLPNANFEILIEQ
ncbi:MAG: hypothetical protein AAGD32_11875, partial [Planctomycetota bacterium]